MVSILQASAWYPPVHLGGTEVYLAGLVRELRAHGVFSRIIAPLAPDLADGYQFDGATVRTYPVNPLASRAELRGDLPHTGFERFRRLLAEERPDIYHQHSWTRGLGGVHLRAAREAGARTVLTVHTPNNLCLRGTMMRFGQEACNGLIDPSRCASCGVDERGAPRSVTRALGALPPPVSAGLEKAMPASRFATALAARALAERRKHEFARMVADADRIVAVSGWLFDALALNCVPADKLVLSRQGVDSEFAQQAAAVRRNHHASADFRLLYVGRWHPVKGIDVLVRAVRAIPPEARISLTIHGVRGGAEEQTYAEEMRCLAAGDARIAIEPPIARERLASILAGADALAVPSLWLETGPLVVMEAKAVGLPVIGSKLGGIAELVREPEDGVLVPHGDVEAWSKAITALAAGQGRQRRSTDANPLRTMCEAAAEMAALYDALRRSAAPRTESLACV
jgi:glycosyltransferase involved in cell wall biosynthesis